MSNLRKGNKCPIKVMATTGSGMSALVKIQLLKEFTNGENDIKKNEITVG